MARDSSRAMLDRTEVIIIGRKDESQGTGNGKASGWCAKKTRDARLGLGDRALRP
jgi:hypothetical protein